MKYLHKFLFELYVINTFRETSLDGSSSAILLLNKSCYEAQRRVSNGSLLLGVLDNCSFSFAAFRFLLPFLSNKEDED